MRGADETKLREKVADADTTIPKLESQLAYEREMRADAEALLQASVVGASLRSISGRAAWSSFVP